MAEEFGAAAGSEKNFLRMLKMATDPDYGSDYGFLFIVFGLRIRFFNSYRSEFQVRQLEDEPNLDNKVNVERQHQTHEAKSRRRAVEGEQ